MSKVKLYIPEALPDTPLATWFAPLPKGQLFVDNLPPNFFEHSVLRVSDLKEARAIVLQNSFRTLDEKSKEYIRTYAQLGERLHKPVFIFSLGDFTDTLRFDDRVYVMRFSVYKPDMSAKDVVIPTTAELHDPVQMQSKRQIPVVGFCGKGAFLNLRAWAGYVVKEVFRAKGARTIGVYWRRAMMRACKSSTLVVSNFIVRHNFSGLQKTIELDPQVARREFIKNIVESDFVLAPKGDGNYSNRFLETLSYGRIPVVIDTDIVLPLEEKINYSKIMVRVPMGEVNKTPEYIRNFYDSLTEVEWKERQEEAQRIFDTYLRQDNFFEYFFANKLPTLKP